MGKSEDIRSVPRLLGKFGLLAKCIGEAWPSGHGLFWEYMTC